MGVRITEEEADAAVCYYDLDGTGEMSYVVRTNRMYVSLSSSLSLGIVLWALLTTSVPLTLGL